MHIDTCIENSLILTLETFDRISFHIEISDLPLFTIENKTSNFAVYLFIFKDNSFL